MDPAIITAVVLIVIALFVITALAKTVRIVPQASSAIVERLGRYTRTLDAGLHILMPFFDKVRVMIDLREQVVSFPPQPVITEDNLVVSIDTVIYYQVTDPKSATYEIANFIQGIEQLTVTTLRNVIGGMDLERTLTSREEINGALRGVLDDATGKWGIRVNRVELKAIDPPASIQDSMEKQMRADRDKRAAILTAEGERQSAILTAEGDKQSAILRAEGDREALILRAQAERESSILKAQGQAQAINTTFRAIHEGRPDQALLSYQYLQVLPQIAQGESNKVWIVPSELGKALEGLGGLLGAGTGSAGGPAVQLGPAPANHEVTAETEARVDESLASANAEVQAAIAAAQESGLGSATAGSTAGSRAGSRPGAVPDAADPDASDSEADSTP